MKRRDFLRYGTAAGTAALVGGELPAEASQLPPHEMSAFLERMDRHMADLSRERTVHDIAPDVQLPTTDGEREIFQRGDQLFRKSLRSLLMVGLVHDLPEESRQHPELQRRLRAALPEMDDAVFGTMAMLRNFTPAERIDLASTIEADPDLPMRVVEAIDREGASLGISTKRRLHLRSIATQVVWRFRHQSPWAVVDECVDKAERVAARVSSREEVRAQVAARQAEEVFWRRRADLLAMEDPAVPPADPASPAQPGAPPAQAPIAPPAQTPLPSTNAPIGVPEADPLPSTYTPSGLRSPPPYGAEVLPPKPTRHESGKELLSTGGILLGIGVPVAGVFTALTLTTSILFAWGITAGAILIVVGIILLIIGAVRY